MSAPQKFRSALNGFNREDVASYDMALVSAGVLDAVPLFNVLSVLEGKVLNMAGENIDTTLAKVEGMMRTIVAAFEKQLDSLYGADALDISTDITVLETMMAREGLTEDELTRMRKEQNLL